MLHSAFFSPLLVLLLNNNLFLLLLYYEVAISSLPECTARLFHTFFCRVKELIVLHFNQWIDYQLFLRPYVLLHLLSRMKNCLYRFYFNSSDFFNNISECSEIQTILSQSMRVDHTAHFCLLLAVLKHLP